MVIEDETGGRHETLHLRTPILRSGIPFADARRTRPIRVWRAASGSRIEVMHLYHVTDRGSAEGIISRGFEDAEVIHDNDELLIGVWLSDRCLAGEDDVGPRLGPVADVALSIELPAEMVEAHERRDSAKPYREFCIPARLLNDYEIGALEELQDVDMANRRRRGRALETP
jgi:hypothetical protein